MSGESGGASKIFRRFIAAARAGSSEARGAILQAYRAYLCRVSAEERHGYPERVKSDSDLAQHALLKAHRRFGDFQGTDAEQFRAWLRTILLNELKQFRRRHATGSQRDAGREVPLDAGQPDGPAPADLASPEAPPDQQAEARERAELVHAAIARLAEEDQDILAWHFQDGLRHAEIGARLGLTDDAARKRCARALERLQEELKALGFMEE